MTLSSMGFISLERAGKRNWEASSSSDEDFSDSDRKLATNRRKPSSSSPPKRRKLQSPLPPKRLKSPSTPPPNTKKSVRFHPATRDNSLWAELTVAKYTSERPPSPHPSHIALPDQNGGLLSSTTTIPLASLPPFPSPSSIPSHAPPPPLRSRSPVPLIMHPTLLAAGATSETDACTDADTEWNIEARNHKHAWSVCAQVDLRVRDDCDDISLPRSSPPPALRQKAGSSEWDGVDREKEAETAAARARTDAKGKGKARETELPSIFMRPPPKIPTSLAEVTAYLNPLAVAHQMTGDLTPGAAAKSASPPALTKEDITRHTHVLFAALAKLPTSEARAAREAVEHLTRWQGQRGYEAGHRDGMHQKRLGGTDNKPHV
ncbi:hypothetical protein DFH11DRAFT_1558838 [Phellopilus nigrolimitatus]|nr:hypothetical protein DFH11DRAFT_1558838 [Phellopilus nigrolimitatus]